MDIAYDLEKLLIGNKPTNCEACGGKMFYTGCGQYRCEDCGEEVLDFYGRVRKFLEDNGQAPKLVIAKETGGPAEIVETFFRDGKVGLPKNSKYYLECAKCGCSIRAGRYCPACVKELAGGIKAIYDQEREERLLVAPNPEMEGKMRFLNRRA